MRPLGFVLLALFGALVVWASGDLPLRGDPGAPAAVHDSVSVYYIQNAYTDTRTPNMVTAVLADYRGFDTFGEAVVVVTAALCCWLILLRRREDEIVDGSGRPLGAGEAWGTTGAAEPEDLPPPGAGP
jgi:multicomponent Na+:H+ antiporter subunit B